MAGEPTLTLVGNLGADPQLQKTPNGKVVSVFNIATTPRKFSNNEWIDGDTMWFRAFVWGKDASSSAVALKKGDKVFIAGRLAIQHWVDKEGKDRVTNEVTVDTYGKVPPTVAEPVTEQPKVADEEPVEDFPW